MKRFMFIALTGAAFAVSACSSTPASPSATAVPATVAPTAVPATAAPSAAASTALGDIVATADGAGSFKTLLAAATAAGLVDTLKGDGPLTVFAPTDAAFAALPAGTLDGLLADPAALKKILLYHVVSGKVTADQVVDLTSADSAEGSKIKIAVKDGKVYLNDTTQVVTPDVMASNGVIHVIDSVLLPPAS